MRIILYGILILFFIGCSPSNEMDSTNLIPISGNWELITTYGGSEEDIAHGIAATSDGGYIVVGNSKSTDGTFSNKKRIGSDIFLMKFNALNEVEWTSTYGGSEDDRGHDVVQLADGGFAVVGYSQSSDGDATRNEGQHDNWVFKVDTQGNLLWEKSFGFLGHDHAYNIFSTSDGGLFFNGFLDVTASNGAGQDGKTQLTKKHGVGEFWCHKLDADGNLQWRRYFGGTSNDRSYDAIETKEGDFVLVGSSESQDVDITNPKGEYDIWVVKIDAKGNLLLQRSVGGSNYDIGTALIEAYDGDLLITGQSYSQDKDITDPLGSSDGILLRMSNEGELKKVQNYGTYEFDSLKDILQRADGTLVMVGYSGSGEIETGGALDNDIFLYYVFADGTLVNKYKIDGEGLDIPEKIAMTTKGQVILVGSTNSTTAPYSNSAGGKDLFVAIWN
jgi:hypothetical protein